MVFDPITGIVRDINLVNGYSGAYCYSNYQTILADDVGNFLSQFNINETLLGMGSGAAISIGVAALICCGPVGWVGLAAFALIGTGVVGNFYACGLNEGISTSKLVNFGLSIGLSAIPYVGLEAGAGRLCVNYAASRGVTRTIMNTISKDAEGYVLTSMPTINMVGNEVAGGVVTSMEYLQYGTVKGATKLVFGCTREEAEKKLVNGLIVDGSKEVMLNEFSPVLNQYDSRLYEGLPDYLR